MRTTAFLNEFDQVATPNDINDLIYKIIPDIRFEMRIKIAAQVIQLMRDYLQMTNRKVVKFSEMESTLTEMDGESKALIREILERFSFMELPTWQSDPRRMDGQNEENSSENILLALH